VHDDQTTPRSGAVPPLGELIRAAEARGFLRTLIPGGQRSPADIEITDVTMDSRTARPGTLFVALGGQHVDGHEFVAEVVRAGAVAIVAERATPGVAVPQILVHASRPALALAAAWFNGYPSRRLGVAGITGTDGKTTTAFLVRSMLEGAGGQTGLLGTISVIAGGVDRGNPGRSTTPEAPELQAHLRAMVESGDEYAVIESTSHGLAQDRVGEVAYDVGVMTNVTHEHLEFHRTHEAYRAAKRRLFERLEVSLANPDKGWPKTGVINADDRWADEFAAAARGAGARVLTYGTSGRADIRAERIDEDQTGMRMEVVTPRWRGPLRVRLAGRFNVYNALAAVGVGEVFQLDPPRLRAGIESLAGVPGRMERVEAGQPFRVIVDYAHTPDSLAKVLDNLAPLAAAGGGGLIAVFGSAGDRDRLKRPMMGRVAAERCRLVVVTDEDPRSEDREAIIAEIADGAEALGRRRGSDLLLIPDRTEAIRAAVEAARPGDVVLLAGKGHERTIEMADGAIPWHEPGVARAALAAVGYAGR
jgi:UDP-N-acetylmuramoyl-L-alanyl-D-glutamate--2,6-diaminopimelate ligase